MALFENYEGRMPQLQPVLDKYGFKSFEDVKAYTNGKGVDAYSIVESTQPICFENVKWAYELGAAIAMKENAKTAAEYQCHHCQRPKGSNKRRGYSFRSHAHPTPHQYIPLQPSSSPSYGLSCRDR